MSNLSDKHCIKSTNLDKSIQSTAFKGAGYFLDKNAGFERSFLKDKNDSNTFTGVLPSQSSGNSQMNQTFKIPSFDGLTVKNSSVRTIKPRNSVKPSIVKNGLKASQQSKISLIPRPSFIISRKSLHGSRSAQLNARKELLKQMVFLHEHGVKNRKELKRSPPVKMLAGLTPKKTPRSGGYFVLPEFNKKVPNLEDIRTPIQNLVKKEMFAYSTKSTAPVEKTNERSPFQLNNKDTSNFIKKPKDLSTEINLPTQSARLNALLTKCKTYNVEVSEIYEKLKDVDSTFEQKIKNLPDYRVYNEFCFYKSKKEALFLKLQKLETDFTNFASTHTKIGEELQCYIKKKQEVLEKNICLHKRFEKAVTSALELEKNKMEEEKPKAEEIEEAQPKAESPKLRRSLRLSKMRKNKFEEKSPFSKKLRKLDAKSKGIQKV